MAERPTLVKPPPEDPTKAPIENVLDVTELSVLGPVSFFFSNLILTSPFSSHHLC